MIKWIAPLVLMAAPAFADPDAAVVNNCLSCHGVDGKSEISFVPIIHGQQQQYLMNALVAYRDRSRTDGHAPVMSNIIKGFSDADLAELASWFSQGANVAQEPALSNLIDVAGENDMRLVYLTDDQGWQRLLGATQNRDYFQVSPWVESEKFLTFCSIASMAAVLNSLPIDRPFDPVRYPFPYFTQDNLFTIANEQVKSFEQVVTDGLVLDQIAEFLNNGMGVVATPHHADDSTPIDQMRQMMIEGLAAQNTRVIVNYNRGLLGQNGGGHVSPVAAYDEQTDSFLVLDVARYKYPPVWIPFSQLYEAMNDKDSSSNESRGIVIVDPA